MELLRTYTIRSRTDGYVWQFKYHLNGVLAEFKVLDGVLSSGQMKWLSTHFPFLEDWIKQWEKQLTGNFEIKIGEPDITFDTVWEMFDHKIKKADSEKKFGKLKDAHKVKVAFSIPGYKYYLQVTNVAQTNLATYIHKQYYEDDWYAAAQALRKKPTGKNHNPALAELANLKTKK